jgi:hypothetical protein
MPIIDKKEETMIRNNLSQHHDTVKTAVALWACHQCQVWWISQEAEDAQTWRLWRLDKVDSPHWLSMPPVWKVSGPDPAVCPECGIRMSEQSISAHPILTPFLGWFNYGQR